MGEAKTESIKLFPSEKLFIIAVIFASGTPFAADFSIASIVMLLSFADMLRTRLVAFNNKVTPILAFVILATLFWVLQYLYYPSSGQQLLVIVKYSVQISVCFAFAVCRPERNYSRFDYLIRCLVILMVLSCVLFSLSLLGINLPTIITKEHKLESFFYLQHYGEDSVFGFMGFRNSGIYWEPGMYQIFLNLILLYYLYNTTSLSKNKRLIVLALTTFSIITTGSVTGYLLASIIFGVYAFFNKLSFIYKLLLVLSLGAILVYIWPHMYELYEIKMETNSYDVRSNDVEMGWKVFKTNPIFGYGIVNDMYTHYVGSDRTGNTNGLMNLLINTGIIGFLFYSYGITKFAIFLSRIFSNKSLFVLIIIWFFMSLMNEPISLLPFVFLIIGYGLSVPRTNSLGKRRKSTSVVEIINP